MSDAALRRLERIFQYDPSDRALFELNVHRVRQGVVDLPLTYDEIQEVESQGRGSLPILEAALLRYHLVVIGQPPSSYDEPKNDEERLERLQRNAVHTLLSAIGRLGDINYSQMLNSLADYFDEHHTGYYSCYSADKARNIIAWFQLKQHYGFNDETSVWDLVGASPLIDRIIVIPDNTYLSRTWTELRSGYWKTEGTPYSGSVYHEGSWGHQRWRHSVPGYGGAESTAQSAMGTVLRKIFRLKYQGHREGSRDPLPPSQRPEEVAFIITQEGVDLISEENLYYRVDSHSGTRSSREPWSWNFLFNFEVK